MHALVGAFSKDRLEPRSLPGPRHHAGDPQDQSLTQIPYSPAAGSCPRNHPLGLSSVAARELYDDVDLVLGLGSRLEMAFMRWGTPGWFDPRRPNDPTLIRVDIDPDEMTRFPPDQAVIGDVGAFCRAAIDAIERRLGKGHMHTDHLRADDRCEQERLRRR